MKTESVFAITLLIMFGAALAFRAPLLDLRPMHADEAVQAARFRDLWQEGRFVYDPNEFHGPTMIYATLPSAYAGQADTFADTTEVTYRAVPVLFGSLLLLLLGLLRDALGRTATICAVLLAAVSPAMVFYSRYYIHETLLAFFTLAAIATAWRYLHSGKLLWCLAAGTSVGLMQATKETAALAYVAAAAATVATLGLSPLVRRGDIGRPSRPWWHFALGLATAVLVAALFLSSFLSNPRGPIDGVATYLPWLHRAGGASPHAHPWFFYLQRLVWWRAVDGPLWSEVFLVGLAVLGFCAAFIPKGKWSSGMGDEPRSWVFVQWIGFYTLTLTLLYSVLPYKTPWCLLQFLLGMILLAGVGASVLLRATRSAWARTIITLMLLLGAGQLGWQAYRASYLKPADAGNPYAYAQTSLDALRLVEVLEPLATVSNDGRLTPVNVIWQDNYYWPLPWYLRQFQDVRYWTRLPENAVTPIVISSPQYDAALTQQLGGTHIMTGFFEIRPQCLAQLWVHEDLWITHLRQLGRI